MGQIWTMIAAAAGVIATLWSLFKAIGALRKWIQEKWQQHKKRRDMPMQILQAVKTINQRIDRVEGDIATLKGDISHVREELNENNQSTATVMLEKMMWAYNMYVLRRRKIPLDVQTALCVMYDQYTRNKMHNHIPADFKERIMECEVE